METNNDMYERLIDPIEERMIAVVTRIMQDHHDAMDVFQEVLAVVWKKLKTIDRHANPHAYILRICVTRSYDALRKKARYRREARLQQEMAAHQPASTSDTAAILGQTFSGPGDHTGRGCVGPDLFYATDPDLGPGSGPFSGDALFLGLHL